MESLTAFVMDYTCGPLVDAFCALAQAYDNALTDWYSEHLAGSSQLLDVIAAALPGEYASLCTEVLALRDYQQLLRGRLTDPFARILGELLVVGAAHGEFRAGPTGIAEKVNQIGNRRARLYFLRLLHDGHLSEHRRLIDVQIFGNSKRHDCRARFLPVYNQLVAAIRVDA